MLLSIITYMTILGSYSARLLPRNDEDFSKLQTQKPEPSQNSFLSKKNYTALSNSRSAFSDNATTTISRPHKWHVGRVTRKQYEIVNLLWRKTKVFVNVEITTQTPTSQPTKTTSKTTQLSTNKPYNFTKKIFDMIQDPFIFTALSPMSQSQTPSYIEFYYSDETGENSAKTICDDRICKLKNTEKLSSYMKVTPKSSFLVFHIKGPLLPRTTILPRSESSSSTKHIVLNKTMVKTNQNLVLLPVAYGKNHSINKNRVPDAIRNISGVAAMKHQTESTTVYDKIKFFEMYDKHTRLPLVKKGNSFQFDYEKFDDGNSSDKILLEHIDQSSHEHNEARHSKKHIIENNKNLSYSLINDVEEISKPKPYLNITIEKQNNMSTYVANGTIVKSETRESKSIYLHKSVSWSTYPFAAVYVYEPLQIHCDAASISAHWLLASGSCLSRLNQRSVLGDGRSAFVAYCGDSWWQPERVSYVKYNLVHPWYHPRDRIRRHLYNIGVIQVVTSMMSACSEWAPVSLMSHQFAANQRGSEASALGWGLDRYDTTYAALELPKASLSIYKGLIFSDSCPGNNGYGKSKRFSDGSALRNVYCLSLPPYSGEERDPVHGGLLLVGGKLIALYLQEERRPWGDQSAQYTGVWNLIPWVAEVAREPDEMESFAD